MGYVVGQEVWKQGPDYSNRFMTTASGTFVPSRINTSIDNGVTSILDNMVYTDECLYCKGATFEANTPYFFHGRIMRLPTEQIFNIQLRVLGETLTEGQTPSVQFVKRITIAKKSTEDFNDWVDVHFIFTPVISGFNCLDFVLTRTAASGDFEANHVRYPAIVYNELSVVNNILSGIGKPLVKIGVQSHPGLEICVNGEGITIGRTGTYEIKNGLVFVNNFSVVSTIDTSDELLHNAQNELLTKYWGEDPALYGKNKKYAYLENENNSDIINSSQIEKTGQGEPSSTSISKISSSKIRNIDAFILDYMYEEA